MNRLIQGKHNS